MSVFVFNTGFSVPTVHKNVQIVKMNSKYYIDLGEFKDSDTVIELSLSLASEVDILRERIKILEEKLMLQKQYDFN
jgi:hypothetical protein